MRFLIFAILIVAPSLYSLSSNRIFEIPKTIFLFISGGALTLYAAGYFLKRDSLSAEHRRKIFHPVSFWMAAYILSFLIACFFSTIKPISFLGSYERHTGFITTALLTCFYFITVVALKKDDVRDILQIVSLTSIGVSLVAAFQSQGIFFAGLEYFSEMFYKRVFGTMSHPVYLGVYLAMTIPVAAAMLLLSPKYRVELSFALGIMVFALVKTLSRGAFIALALSTFGGVYLFIKYVREGASIHEAGKRLNWRYAVFSCLILVLGTALLFYAFPVLQSRLATLLHVSQESRVAIYKGVLRMIKDNPWFGTGPDTFRVAFLPYKTLEAAKAFPLTNHDLAHNQFLHIWATAGIFSFIAYVGLLATMLLTNLHILKHPGATRPVRVYALGIICATIGYIAAMMPAFDNSTTLLILYALAASTVLLHQSVAPEAPETKTVTSLNRRSARYAFSMVTAVSGVAFISFGAALWIAEYFSVAGNNADKPENIIAYYKKAVRWMPHESYYAYVLATYYLDYAFSGISAEEKNAALLNSATILENSFSYTWQPDNHVILLGRISTQFANFDRAEAMTRNFLRFDPYSEGARINLITLLNLQGKWNDSLALLEKWIEEFPFRDTYYWNMATIYLELGDMEKAKRYLEKAYELDPSNNGYKTQLEQVREATGGSPDPVLANADGKPIIILEPLSKASELRPVRVRNASGSPFIAIEALAMD